MSAGPIDIYRARILRVVVDVSPCQPYQVPDRAALDRICARLVDSEEAMEHLRAKGYGKAGMTLTEIVALLPALKD